MIYNKNRFLKALSCLCTAVLCASVFLPVIQSVKAQMPYSLDTSSISRSSVKIKEVFDDNLLKNQLPISAMEANGIDTLRTYNDGCKEYDNYLKALTDIDGGSIRIANGNGATLVYEFEKRTKVNKLAFVLGSNGSGKEISYEAYISDEKENLFNAADLVFKWNAEDDTTSAGQIVTFNSGDEPKGKFLGIKITKTYTTDTNSKTTARISEIGAWGEEIQNFDLDTSTIAGPGSVPEVFKNSLIKDALPIAAKNAENRDITFVRESGTGTYENQAAILTDETSDVVKLENAENSYLTYQLNGKFIINKFALAQGKSGGNEISYELYISQDKKDLYKSANLAFTWIAGNNTDSKGQIVSFGYNKPSGKYLGIKINSVNTGTGDYKDAYIAGIAVWGIEEAKINEDVKTISSYGSVKNEFKNSILSGLVPFSKKKADGISEDFYIGKVDGDFSEIEDDLWKALTDGENTRVFISGAQDATIVYKLNNRTKLEKFAFAQGDVGIGIEVSYDVFVSDDTDDIFAEQNKFYSYDARDTKNENSYGQIVTFNYDNPVGKYLGIKFTNVPKGKYNNNTSARIAEIGLWGTSVREKYDLATDTITSSNEYDLLGLNFIGINKINEASDSAFYELDSFYKLKTLAVLNENNIDYELYISSYKDDTSSAQLMFSWDSSTDNLSKGQLVSFAVDKPIGKYLILKIKNGSISDLAKFGLVGEKVKTSSENLDYLNRNNTGFFKDKNLMVGMNPINAVHADGTEFAAIKSWSSVLTDEKSSVSDAVPSDARGAKITYKFISSVTVDTFALWQGNPSYGLGVSYEVYVSDSQENLYTADKMIYSYDASLDKTSNGQMVDFYYAKPSGQYLGILITGTCTDDCGGTGQAHNAARITEIAVCGEYDFTNMYAAVNRDKTQSDIEALAQEDNGNLLSGSNEIENTGIDTSLITDANLSTTSRISSAGKTRLTFEMIRSANVKAFLLAAKNKISSYDVFVATDKESLYAKDNWALHYEAQSESDLIQYYSLDKKEIRYIGIEIADSSAEIAEIGIYGDWLRYIISYPDPKIQTTDWGDTNILKGREPILRYLNGTSASLPSKFHYSGWTDDKVGNNDHLDLSNGKKTGISITFPLGKKYIINKFALYNHRTIILDEFEVYIGNSQSTLYNNTNLVAVYKNTNDSWAQVITLADADKRTGKYIGFRFPTANRLTNDTLRLSEIVACGEEYVPKPGNLSERAMISIFNTSEGKTAELTDSELSLEQKNKLSDINNNDTVLLKGSGTKSFVADLTTSMQIDKLKIAFANSNIKKFNVYVGEYKRDLWISPKLAYTYERQQGNTDETIEFPVDFKSRFIRIEFTDTGADKNISMKYFSAIGPDDQLLENENLLYGMSQDNISTYVSNNATGEYTEVSTHYYRRFLVDGATTYGAAVWGAKYGSEATNIVFKFDNTKFLNSVKMHLFDDDHYRVKNCEIYLGKSLTELMSKDNKPVATYKRTDGDGVADQLEIKFASQETNYVRVCFKDACDDYVSPESIMAVMTEIEAFGVESYYEISKEEKENTVATEFTDPKTGFKFEVLKLNENDIYKDLVDMKVSKSQLTASEKKAITGNGMVETGNNYKLNLIDYLGQSVENFEGRVIRVSVPSEDSGLVYLAGYDMDEFTLLNARYEDNFLVYEVVAETPHLLFSIVKENDVAEDDSENNEENGDEDYDNEDYDDDYIDEESDGNEDYDENENYNDSTQKGGKKVRVRRVTTLNLPLIITLGAGALLVVGGGVTTAVIFIKKHKKHLK